MRRPTQSEFRGPRAGRPSPIFMALGEGPCDPAIPPIKRVWNCVNRVFKRCFERIENGWIGDLIGLISIFVLGYALLVFGWAVS